MRGKKEDRQKLDVWQRRYRRNKELYENELKRMDRREAIYNGTTQIKGAPGAAQVTPAAHVRNVAAELIESQVSSAIPQPKVTPLRPEDEDRARLIEDLLRNELARLPMAYNNDQEERTTPMQGGALSHIEWDTTQRTQTTSGALYLGQIHPKKFIPQAGVYTDIEDMDYCFVDVPQTKTYIKRRYGVDVGDESEERPEARGQEADTSKEEDLVTQHIAYFRNEEGGIGLFSWVNDLVLVDMEDYQARRAFTCAKCGQKGDGVECQYCGSTKFTEGIDEFETLLEDIQLSNGKTIPAWTQEWVPAETLPAGMMDGPGMPTAFMRDVPTKIPYYKPDVYPVVLRKNVSVFGKLLGDSDIDAIEDQQETLKKIETKLIEKLFKGGSFLTAGEATKLDTSDKDLKILRVKNVQEKQLIDVLNLQPNVTGDFDYMALVYEEARQRIGITDSFQGRKDPTATSGVAKEFAAKQSAGRLESKRVMKEAYYSRLFEVMFKFILAYSDEPRTVVSTDNQGHTKYTTFSRYDFLEQDADGRYYWNDRFLFSVDPSATLTQDREALWKECRLNFQQGCFGPVQNTQTLLTFWTRMEQLHYPGASDMKTALEQQVEAEQAPAQPAGQQIPDQETILARLAAAQGSAQVPGANIQGGVLPTAADMGGGLPV